MKKRTICGILLISATLLNACGQVESPASIANTYVEPKYETAASVDVCYEEVCEPSYYSDTNSYVNREATAVPESRMEKNRDYDDYYDDYKNPSFRGEEYSETNENGYMSAKLNPLSTFAADVDTASYSNFRRFVNSGCTLYDIPAGSIRTEEMVNYFSYNYEKPIKNLPFGVNATISYCPWNDEAKLMVIGVNTEELDSSDIPSSNIVFLIDVSGSMYSDNKLPLVKNAMELLIKEFDVDDRISIVTYASGTEVVLDGERGNKHKAITRAFDSLKANGSTAGASGLELAYKTAERNFIEGGINRVILCTDGDFNVGPSSQSELEDLISEKRDSGIFLSVLGFGMGNYSDTRMETLADCGNGNYAYIDTLSEAKKVLVDEMTSTFFCIAKDVKLQVEFNPATVKAYRQVGYENRQMAEQDFTDDTKDGGEIGAGHQVTVLYEIILNDESVNSKELKYQKNVSAKEGVIEDEFCTLSIAYKDPDADKSQYLEFPIGVENYTNNPDNDYEFAAIVAQTSLALRDSDYLEQFYDRGALKDAIDRLGEMRLKDEYKHEFYELLQQLYEETVIYGRRY